MAANLSAVMDDTDKVRQFHEDAVAQRPRRSCRPDVNASEYRFVPVDRATIRYGLGAVKGTGEARDQRDRRGARRERPVRATCSISASRVDKRIVNRRVRGGAGARGRLRFARRQPRAPARLGRASRSRRRSRRWRRRPRRACSAKPRRRAAAPRVSSSAAPWDMRQRLTEEKAALGFYLSGHLFKVYERELAGFPRVPLAKLAARRARHDGGHRERPRAPR